VNLIVTMSPLLEQPLVGTLADHVPDSFVFSVGLQPPIRAR